MKGSKFHRVDISTKAFRETSSLRSSSTSHCSARSAVHHVHCFCRICNGKAANYRTQISRLTSRVFFETEITRDAEPIGGKL